MGLFYKTERPTYEERYAEIIKKAKSLSCDNITVKDIMKQFQ
jgi:hypothetical protein